MLSVVRSDEGSTWKHVAATFAPFLVCLIISLLVSDVGATFSFIGAVSRSSLFFTFPAAMVLWSPAIARGPHPLRKPERVGCYCILVLGLIVLFVGLSASIVRVT